MSTPHIAWAFAQRGLTAAQRLVLIALAERANGERTCFPSEETLAADCELSLRSVAAAVKYLQHKKVRLIEVVSDKAERAAILAKAGARLTARVNVYRILRPADGAKSARPNGSYPQASVVSAKSAPSTPADSADFSKRACKKQQIEHAPFAHESLKEPLNEKKRAAQVQDSGVKEASEGQQEPEPTADRDAAQQAYATAMWAIRGRNPKRLAARYPTNSVDQQLAATQPPSPPPPELKLNPALAPAVLAARAALAESAARRWQVAA